MMTARQQSSSKTLGTLLANISGVSTEYPLPDADIKINHLVMDSRQVRPGDAFIAVSGESANGLDYINAAIEAGAVAVLWEAKDNVVPFALSESFINKQSRHIPLVAITDLREKLGEIANLFYGQPSESLNIVAVTGTNGKTSCINFIAQALDKEQHCGLIGTLGTGIYPDINVGTHTTPDVITLHKTLAEFVKQDAVFTAIEVSSHALAQRRIDNVLIDTAIFTNLTQDHLDYHGTMDDYLKEKAKLFQLPSLKTAIVNVNDPYGLDIIKSAGTKNIVTYGVQQDRHSPDVYATAIQYFDNRIEFTLHTKQGAVAVVSGLAGEFNVSNLLAVSAYLELQGYTLEKIAEKISAIEPVAGRMQKIKTTNSPLVIVDYAHTPDALQQVLQTLSKQFKGQLTCVFGCGGERDKDKRSKMGEVASRYADHIVLTNDNPRSESAEKIIEQISQGINDKTKVNIVPDRKKAIETAIKHSSLAGCVVVAGKGHENYQIIGNKKIAFNDLEVVKEILSEK